LVNNKDIFISSSDKVVHQKQFVQAGPAITKLF